LWYRHENEQRNRANGLMVPQVRGSVVPRVLPAEKSRAVLSGSVHQEEPHAGAETSSSESVERADGVDVDGVGAMGSSRTSGTGHCV